MIPDRLLRTLTVRTPVLGPDSRGNDFVIGWTDAELRGRVDQVTRAQVTADGRQASVTEWLLLTNEPVADAAQIGDGDLDFEVAARPWPVYGSGERIHHYEATLRLVEG